MEYVNHNATKYSLVGSCSNYGHVHNNQSFGSVLLQDKHNIVTSTFCKHKNVKRIIQSNKYRMCYLCLFL